jgi:hypothetical protein
VLMLLQLLLLSLAPPLPWSVLLSLLPPSSIVVACGGGVCRVSVLHATCSSSGRQVPTFTDKLFRVRLSQLCS